MAEEKKPDPPREKDYDWGAVLGKGAFGKVKLGTVKATGQKFAVKVIQKQDLLEKKKTQAIVFRERELLHHLGRHPLVVTLHYTFQSPTSLFFVMDYCPNGEMFDQLKKLGSFSVECTQHYVAEMIMALEHIHSKGVMHRDFKPENILFNEDWHIKVIDFGTAKNIGAGGKSGSFEGTPEYMSPELLINNSCDTRCDYWALGVIVYQLLTGKLPFRGNNPWHTMQLVRERDFVYPEGFPPQGKDLCEKLMNPDPGERMVFPEIKDHPFFEGINWDTLITSAPPPLVALDPPLKFADTQSPADKTPADTKTESEEEEPVEKDAKDTTEIAHKVAKAQPRNSKYDAWQPFLVKEENVIKTGIVFKKRRKFNIKRRQLILTDKPRLIYIDITKMKEQGSIPTSQVTKIISRTPTIFVVSTPTREFLFEDKNKGAEEWVAAIKKALGK
eukprot:TRINITY_DN4307_c0_g1_i1.p1 TRINITY_DN4307_c0_g1~~TRINITY_DN4307_c0_g1_i1.p1  ORF type:complete len:444 (-),score=81.69 TRINITY_DN4307_c0_g1_i1:1204-2535(-)